MIKKIQSLRNRIVQSSSVEDQVKVEKTALALEGMNFTPIFLLEIPNFLRITKEEMLRTFDFIVEKGEEELKDRGFKQNITNAVIQQLNMMVYWYMRLLQLRIDDPRAWDEINELYEDD